MLPSNSVKQTRLRSKVLRQIQILHHVHLFLASGMICEVVLLLLPYFGPFSVKYCILRERMLICEYTKMCSSNICALPNPTRRA